MIMRLWQPLFTEVSFRDKSAGIAATLYSLGLARADGTLRLLHARATMNRFGEAAHVVYDSFELQREFFRQVASSLRPLSKISNTLVELFSNPKEMEQDPSSAFGGLRILNSNPRASPLPAPSSQAAA
jgi:hypothetical protein